MFSLKGSFILYTLTNSWTQPLSSSVNHITTQDKSNVSNQENTFYYVHHESIRAVWYCCRCDRMRLRVFSTVPPSVTAMDAPWCEKESRGGKIKVISRFVRCECERFNEILSGIVYGSFVRWIMLMLASAGVSVGGVCVWVTYLNTISNFTKCVAKRSTRIRLRQHIC